jgi:GNAT superfamily N-acetyltransferase
VPNGDFPWKFRIIETDDDLRKIKASKDSDSRKLREFLFKNALLYKSEGLAQTYGLFAEDSGEETIIAYMTLVSSGIDTGPNISLLPRRAGHPSVYEAHNDLVYPYTVYPAVKIARMMVGADHRRQGCGDFLVMQAVNIVSRGIRDLVGCRFLVVDAKQAAVGFYERCGFKLLTKIPPEEPHDTLVMHLDVTGALRAADELTSMASGAYLHPKRNE